MYTATRSTLLVCFVIGVTFLLDVHAKELGLNHEKLQTKFKNHWALLKKEGACTPKIRLQQIMNHPDALPGVTYYPSVAVLHVCDATGGCCDSSSRHCQPAEIEELEIVFMVKHWNNKRGQPWQTFTFQNHTRCECEEQTNAPR